MYKLSVGEIIKMVRSQYCARPLTQEEVAVEMGVSRSFIAAIEGSEQKIPPDSFIEKFALTFGRNETDRSYFLREMRLAVGRVKSARGA